MKAMDDLEMLWSKAAEACRTDPPRLDPEVLRAFVTSFLQQAPALLAAVREHGTPLYLFDRDTLLERAAQFKAAFSKYLEHIDVYYAVKSNHYPELVKALVEFGLGLDVSSGDELALALETGCRRIVFSGPGKTDAELELAAAHHQRVTVLLDSFGELARLDRVAARARVTVRAGVRLTTQETGLWRKFGVPLGRLEEMLRAAARTKNVQGRGLQFHTSWNLDPSAQTAFIARLGGALAALPPDLQRSIEFIDIGGGFWPPRGEWLTRGGTPRGRLAALADPGLQPSTEHFVRPAADIETFAREIGRAVQEHLRPHFAGKLCAEPGRWLSNDAMHLLLTVIDKKAPDLVVTDGGTNVIGWERFESEYSPVINLTRPGLEERGCLVLGSLCTPHDVWGQAYFGKNIQEGDVLLLPCQGAYTYSLRQRFIKSPAKVVPCST
jgi:diaminopimelate decarboxylase